MVAGRSSQTIKERTQRSSTGTKKSKNHARQISNVKIKDFRIRLQGRFYGAHQLDRIPDDLKTPNTATRQNDNAIAFFGRASPLSNHHICNIVIAFHI